MLCHPQPQSPALPTWTKESPTLARTAYPAQTEQAQWRCSRVHTRASAGASGPCGPNWPRALIACKKFPPALFVFPSPVDCLPTLSPPFPPFALFPTICIYSPCPSTASGPPCSKHCRRINHPKKKRVILSFPYSLLQLLLLSQRKRQTRPVLHRVSVYDCHINAPQRVLTLRKGERKR